jgi:serine/threonine protein kinase
MESGFNLYTQLTDVFSFGMIIYEMFSEKVPFEEMDDDQVKIEDFIIPINFSPILRNTNNCIFKFSNCISQNLQI